MPSPLVDVQNLSKSYAQTEAAVQALKEINLKIYPHQSIAIMGPSGSGKSTLLHLLGCLDLPTTGRYLLAGQEVSRLDDLQLSLIRATKIGFVFQAYNLIDQLTVFENVKMPFMYQSPLLSEEEIENRVTQSLERVALLHRKAHYPNELSGGESQRTAIARAIAIQPLLLLADEPTGNLDSRSGEGILNLFEELHRQGTTIIIVTHDQKVAARCQLTLHMQDGTLQ